MCEIDAKVCEVAKKYFSTSTATALLNESKPKFELVSMPGVPPARAPSPRPSLRPLTHPPTPFSTHPFPPPCPALYGRCSVHGAAQERV